jgi:hypothetical protein
MGREVLLPGQQRFSGRTLSSFSPYFPRKMVQKLAGLGLCRFFHLVTSQCVRVLCVPLFLATPVQFCAKIAVMKFMKEKGSVACRLSHSCRVLAVVARASFAFASPTGRVFEAEESCRVSPMKF